MSDNQISINNLSKIYDNGFEALKNINLEIKKGEIFAMLGPNGAGKTTLISIVCGIVKPSSGKVLVENFDIINDYRETRSRIGLVPQELTLEQFETVFNNVSYSRGLYGKKPDPLYIEKVLKQLSLWDKKDLGLRQLSGGMKRRLLIAKAMVHQPPILVLDEPTAGVDVELRNNLWENVKELNNEGVTIILTTHYLIEAQEMCDRIAIIDKGNLVALDTTERLLERIKTKKINFKVKNIDLERKLFIEDAKFKIINKNTVSVTYEKNSLDFSEIVDYLNQNNIEIKDISTEDGDLEDVFVQLTKH